MRLEQDILRAVPQRALAERPELFGAFRDCQKMVAGKLSSLAAEIDRAVGEQDFRLADAAGVEDDLAGRRIAFGILITETDIEIAQGNPAGLAAPTHVNDSLSIRQH